MNHTFSGGQKIPRQQYKGHESGWIWVVLRTMRRALLPVERISRRKEFRRLSQCYIDLLGYDKDLGYVVSQMI